MKEWFIVEPDANKISIYRVITLMASAVLLIVFAGCTPSKPSGIDKSKPWAAVHLTIDQTSKYAPSFSVWVEDEMTGEVSTLAATQKIAQGKLTNRPATLPVWSAVKAKSSDEAADTYSSATPAGASATLTVQIPDKYKGQKILLWVEANVSYDYNDYYKEGLKSGDAGYNDVNGQPSVLWKAAVDLAASPSGTAKPVIAGHGDVLGANGGVDADMSNITTAASILKSIEIEYNVGGGK